MDIMKMLGINLSEEQKKELITIPKRLAILEKKIDYIYKNITKEDNNERNNN